MRKEDQNSLRNGIRKMTAFTAALALAAGLLLTGCGSGTQASSDTDTEETGAAGGGTASGMAECTVEEENITYMIYVRVETDEDGTILSVEDDGTEVPDGKDGKYKQAQAIFDELVGKNADTVSEVDVVSGATYSSQAILEAVQSALQE